MDPQKPGLLPRGARRTAARAPDGHTGHRRRLLDWLKAQPLDWQREINNLARFYMETSNQPVPPPHEFDRFTYYPEADHGPA